MKNRPQKKDDFYSLEKRLDEKSKKRLEEIEKESETQTTT